VAILDIAMPLMDGLEAARAIRGLAAGEDVLLLALSGFGHESDKRRSIAAGFDEHLVKPVDLARIDELLASRLSRSAGSGARQERTSAR
jgi:DNA-binding response OmpR family regulator